MSNPSIASRIEDSCLAYEAGRLTLRELAWAVKSHAGAFEALSFGDYTTLQSIAYGLSIEASYAEEGCEFEVTAGRLIEELRAVLLRVEVE